MLVVGWLGLKFIRQVALKAHYYFDCLFGLHFKKIGVYVVPFELLFMNEASHCALFVQHFEEYVLIYLSRLHSRLYSNSALFTQHFAENVLIYLSRLPSNSGAILVQFRLLLLCLLKRLIALPASLSSL